MCVKGYSILLKLLRFKFEVKLQRRMVHDEFLQVLEQDRYGILRSWFRFQKI